MDRRLVDHLVNAELISRGGMQRAILRASKNKVGIVEQLIESGSIPEADLADGIASCYGHKRLDVREGFDADPAAFNLIGGAVAADAGVLPFGAPGGQVEVALFDPESAEAVLDTLETATGHIPTIFVAPRSFVLDAIGHYYSGKEWPDQPKAAPQAAPKPAIPKLKPPQIAAPTKQSGVVGSVPKRISRAATPPANVPAPAPAPPPEQGIQGGIEAALNDFDAFLDSADFMGDEEKDPLADEELGWNPVHEGIVDADAFGITEHVSEASNAESFDLFEQSEIHTPTLDEIIDAHQRKIDSLSAEIKGQREVVSTLVDILVENRVLNRKELMRRVKAKRQS